MTAFQTRGHVDLRVALAAGEVRIESVDTPGVDVQLVPLRDNTPRGRRSPKRASR